MDIAANRFVAVLGFAEMIIAVSLFLYSHYFKLDALQKYFEGNDVVRHTNRRWPGNRPMDRAMRMSQIAMFLIFPKSYIRRGDVSEKEIASIPLSLKRWATWPYYFGIQLFAWVWVLDVLNEL
ncbi:hypothetical protein [Pseudomonas sp. DWRC2-2]|uniref:hypothetical protein n=1 Tax=Pseudomonas sp. DWRC2-2 TaxID=2804567 RepID=UPI003CE6BCF6